MNEEKGGELDVPDQVRLGRAAFVAALVLLGQNVAVFVAFLLVLGGASQTALSLAGASFFADVPALLLLGLGLALFGWRQDHVASEGAEGASGETRPRPHLLRVSGLLCLLSALLAGLWRWGVPALVGVDFPQILLALLDSDGGAPPGLEPYAPHLRAMLLLWMGASSALAGATYALRGASRGAAQPLLLEEKVDLRSWEGFATLNAAATFFVALEMLRILDGRPGGSLLLAGIFLKATIVPLNGAFAYGYLARRAWQLRRGDRAAPPEEAVTEKADRLGEATPEGDKEPFPAVQAQAPEEESQGDVDEPE